MGNTKEGTAKLVHGQDENGKIKHISEVKNGKNCGCICPECETVLIARQGKEKVHHFAHDNGANCPKAPETALHKLGKQIVTEHREIWLSKYRTLKYKKAELEKQLDEYFPDVTLYKNASDEISLLVEIVVTSELKPEKQKVLNDRNYNILEIDLSDTPRHITKDELTPIIIGETDKKKFHRKSESGDGSGGFFAILIIGFFAFLWNFFRKKKKDR